jgi:hypothetical protein
MVVAGAALAVALSSGCKEDRETQITVAISSETKVPDEIDALEVVVTDFQGSERARNTNNVDFQTFFPTTLAVIPRSSASLDHAVQIDVRAVKGKTNVVLRRALVSFVEGRTLLLPMPLRMACFAIESCGPNQTCAGGTCVDADKDGKDLLDFDPALVFGDQDGGDCFDEDQCLPTSTEVPLGDPKACTFTIPDSGTVNVSIRWAAAANRVIALEAEDPEEGWTREGPTVGKLSKGVCKALVDQAPVNKALGVFVSNVCPPKRATQPYCSGGGVGVDLAGAP